MNKNQGIIDNLRKGKFIIVIANIIASVLFYIVYLNIQKIIILIVVFLLIASAVFTFIYLSKLQSKYESNIKDINSDYEGKI